jgi:hypothetical protein
VGERSQKALERLDDGPIYTVYLDSGSFHWLKEIIEAKQRYQIWLKAYQRLVSRTLLSFNEAEKALLPPPPDGEVRKRVVPRKLPPKKRTKKL